VAPVADGSDADAVESGADDSRVVVVA